MPETKPSSSAEAAAAAAHDPATVGSTFMRQYYHLLAKEPASLHRFYKDDSIWCHGVGSHMQAPIAGQKAINDEILRRGYAGARVDLDIGSIDCQASLHGGVFVLVTGVMTLTSSPVPKPFVQTFFLAVQPKGYFVLNDCLRFLELPLSPLSSAADLAVTPTEAKKQVTHAAIGTPVASPVVTKPATPVAHKAAAPMPASPVKKSTVASPVKVASPKAAMVPPSTAAAPASPVKKAAPTEVKTVTPKPSETKPATPASPLAAKVASPVKTKPAEPAAPVAPPAPKTWAALFSPATASTTPKAKPTPVSPAVKPADVAVAAAPVSATASAPTNQEKEKKRYSSIYIRDLPAQAKESDLRELFKSYGEIANITVPPGRGFAFVDYFHEESTRAVLADSKEFKLLDKLIHVDERTDRKDKDRSSGGTGGRGGRGGAPKSSSGGRSGERKEREDGKERSRPATDKQDSSNNGSKASNGGGAPRTGERRDKGGRRSGKERAE